MAEAYLNSLQLPNVSAMSSGTVAAAHKTRNLVSNRQTLDLLEEHGIGGFAKASYGDQLTQRRLDKGDITVCMNQRVYADCRLSFTLSAALLVWSVADIGEPGRISETEAGKRRYREDAYQEIVKDVERLVRDRGRGPR